MIDDVYSDMLEHIDSGAYCSAVCGLGDYKIPLPPPPKPIGGTAAAAAPDGLRRRRAPRCSPGGRGRWAPHSSPRPTSPRRRTWGRGAQTVAVAQWAAVERQESGRRRAAFERSKPAGALRFLTEHKFYRHASTFGPPRAGPRVAPRVAYHFTPLPLYTPEAV